MSGNLPVIFEHLLPHLAPALAPPARERLTRLAGVIPPISRGIFECHLGDASTWVDFGLSIAHAEVIAGLNGVRPDPATHAVPVWGEGDCRAYQSLIQGGIGQYLEHLRRFIQFVFLGAPEFFYRKVILKS